MTRKRQLFKTIIFYAVLASGLLLVRAGALPVWAWILLTLAAIAMRVLSGMDQYAEELSITEDGVTRTHGWRLRRKMQEFVGWHELTRVEAISMEAGPERKDVLFLLYGAQAGGVAVPAPLAQQHDLAGQLRRRLPGFRDDELTHALAAAERLTFVLWETNRVEPE